MPDGRKDPATTSGAKLGRPKDPLLELARSTFPDISERSIARWVRGMKMMRATGVPRDVQQRIAEACSTKRGGFKFATFERAAEDVAAAHIVDASEESPPFR